MLRWGIVAPGTIADFFAATVSANTDQRLAGVASRSPARSEAFARLHGITTAYPDYAQMLADPAIDIIYVAAPHAAHKALALAAIDAGKHVLVEKPIALSAAEATEIAQAEASDTTLTTAQTPQERA